MNEYIGAINMALRSVTLARDIFAMEHGEDFDIDWVLEQFEDVFDTLERLMTYHRRNHNE